MVRLNLPSVCSINMYSILKIICTELTQSCWECYKKRACSRILQNTSPTNVECFYIHLQTTIKRNSTENKLILELLLVKGHGAMMGSIGF